MKIISLIINNFLTIGEAKISLDDKGLVLIQGDNRDDSSAKSNGAGKSSVVDALSWCLFGETARGVGGDAVVNLSAKKNTSVSVWIEDGTNSYRIARARKPNSLTVEQLSIGPTGVPEWMNLTKGTEKETQEVISKILGCSSEVFNAAVYAGQEAMPDLPGMTDKQLKLLIEEAAGIELLNQAYRVAQTKANDANSRRIVLQNKVESAERAVVAAQASLDHLVAESKKGLEQRGELIKKLALDAKTLSAEVTKTEEEIVKHDEAGLIKIRDEATAKIDGLAAERAGLEALSKAETEARSRYTAASTKVQHCKDNYERAKRALANVESKIGKPCSACGKPHLAEDVETVRTIAAAELAEMQAKLDEAVLVATAVKNEAATAIATVKEFKAKMTNVEATTEALSDAMHKLATVANLKTKARHDRDKVNYLVQRVKALVAEPPPLLASINVAKKELEETNTMVASLRSELEKAKSEEELAQDAVKVFGPAGVRAHILDTVTPFLNDKTAEYLGALSDGAISAKWSTLGLTAKGEVREKFNIEVSHAKGADHFSGLSGGEKRKVRLACALALQDLVATRATKPIDLFIADEVDHALDESGLERLMTVLEKKARERGTVLVISHNSLSDWIDNVVTVVKEGGVSRLEV